MDILSHVAIRMRPVIQPRVSMFSPWLAEDGVKGERMGNVTKNSKSYHGYQAFHSAPDIKKPRKWD